MSLVTTNLSLQYALNFLCTIGILISLYGLIVEIQLEHNPSYTPFCDYSSWISCSKALDSKWGKGFGLVGRFLGENHWLNQRNVIYGVAFYCFMMALGVFSRPWAANFYFYLAVVSNLVSVFLGYILYFELKSLCIVCVSTYVVNFVILLLSIWRRRIIYRMKKGKYD